MAVLAATDIARRLAHLREAAPLVQCLTNSVVMNFTANVLLAAGAAPAMVDIPGEAGMFARVASALLVNLGTPYAERREAMLEAARAAADAGTPWVLDPVAIGSLPIRTALAAELLALRPTVVRGNPSEILALAGTGAGGRGVDSVSSPAAAVAAAHALARAHGCVVAISGATDVITDGTMDFRLGNGDRLLTRVTGGGCALGALMAAFVGADGSDPLHAVAATVAVYTIAAEVAAVGATGPGSFAVRLLDALASIDEATIEARLFVA